MGAFKEHIEIEYLKTLTYKQINDFIIHLDNEVKRKHEALKLAYSLINVDEYNYENTQIISDAINENNFSLVETIKKFKK